MSFGAGKGALKLKGDDSTKKKKRKKKGKELAQVDGFEGNLDAKVDSHVICHATVAP